MTGSTSSRMLELLSLLQARSFWRGADLAERLGTTQRTLRRDVDRLRELGYRVASARGPAGGYSLEAGNGLPPLVLTEDEAVAIALGLHAAGANGLLGGRDLGVGALAKLEQVLPSHLRRRVAALHSHVRSAGRYRDGGEEVVSPDLLGRLALACRDGERLRLGYTSSEGAVSERHLDPHALVNLDRRWYLVAWDLRRDDWRTFRLDRIGDVRPTALRVAPRTLPTSDAAEFVRSSISAVRSRYTAAAVVDLPIAVFREEFGPWALGAEPVDEGRTRWPIGGDSLPDLLHALVYIPEGVAYRLEAEPEVRAWIAAAGLAMAAAAGTDAARVVDADPFRGRTGGNPTALHVASEG